MSLPQHSFSKQRQYIINVDTLPDKLKLKTTHFKRSPGVSGKYEAGVGENTKPLDDKSDKDEKTSLPG